MNSKFFFISTTKKQTNEIINKDKNNINDCIQKFTFFITKSTPSQLIQKVISLSLNCQIEENLIRPTSWKILLGNLPTNPDSTLKDWIDITVENRKAYQKKKKKFVSLLKKLSGDPLGGDREEHWNQFFEDSEIKKLICLDVNRTFPDRDLFCMESTKNILKNILFLWSKENISPSYKQGMNDILAILLYALYPFYFKSNKTKIQKKNIEEVYSYLNNIITYQRELYEFFHDEKELESDLYYLFTSIMEKGMTKFFESENEESAKIIKDEKGKDKVVPYLAYRIYDILQYKLNVYDTRLFHHFKNTELDCGIVLQRWLRCLFNREFHPKDVSVLWDAILAFEIKEGTCDFALADYFSIAMLNYIKEDLFFKEQNDALIRLFHFPPLESIYTLVKFGLNLRDELVQKEKDFKYKEEMKIKRMERRNKLNEEEYNSNSKNENNATLNSNTFGIIANNYNTDNTNSNQFNMKSNEDKNDIITEDNNNKYIRQQNIAMITILEEMLKKYKKKMNDKDIGRAGFLFDQLKKSI